MRTPNGPTAASSDMVAPAFGTAEGRADLGAEPVSSRDGAFDVEYVGVCVHVGELNDWRSDGAACGCGRRDEERRTTVAEHHMKTRLNWNTAKRLGHSADDSRVANATKRLQK